MTAFIVDEQVTIAGILYLVVGRNDMGGYPNTRARMDECDIKGYVSLRRPRGRVQYQGVEYNSGMVKL